MTGFDLTIVVLMPLLAYAGYRLGLLVSVLSFGGFLVGILVGLAAAPHVVGGLDPGPARALLALAVVLLFGVLAQSAGSFIGATARNSMSGRATLRVDAALGAVAALLALFTGAWLVGSAAADADDLPFAEAARDSVIVSALDSNAPVESSDLLSSFATMVDRSGFPSVFSDADLEQISPVPAPDPAVLDAPGVRAAAASLVKVLGDAPSCGRRLEGSGFVVDDHRVMTNAHVVAGTAGLAVLPAGSTVALPATVVVFDPDTDVAILDVPGLEAPALHFGAELSRGDDAVVAGYPGNGPLRATPARVRGRITAVGADVYGTGSVERDVYALRAKVRSGNSGGPMLNPAGDVVGMVFAASVDDPSTGYALTPDAVRPALAASRTATLAVPTGACAPG